MSSTPQSLIGKPCNHTIWGPATNAVSNLVRKTFETGHTLSGESGYPGSEQPEDDRGPFISRDVHTYPIFSQTGEVDQVIIFAQDISEKHHLQATLFRSANLASVGQLASSIAHEINNPLTVVIANSQVLQMDIPTSDPNQALVDYILEAGTRIQHIVQNLLDFSTQEKYEWFRVEVDRTIDDALMLIAAPLRKGNIKVIKQIESLPAILASPNHLKSCVDEPVAKCLQRHQQANRQKPEWYYHHRRLTN